MSRTYVLILCLGLTAGLIVAGCGVDGTGAQVPATGAAGTSGPATGMGGMMTPHPGVPGEIGGGQAGAAGGAAGASADGGAAGAGTGPDGGAASNELCHGLGIQGVAIYQAVKIDLVRGGQVVPKLDTPVITSRPALVRIFVAPAAGFQARPVVAQLGWNGGTRSATMQVFRVSDDGDTGSTFNFELGAAEVTAGITWSVTLRESAGRSGTGSTDGAAIPAVGTTVSMTTTSTGPSIKIVLVPVRYGGDKSQRLPDTSAAQLQFLTDAMFSTYPVAKVEAQVHAPLDHAGVIDHLGAGWSDTLAEICALRKQDQPARNVFYYGMVAPGTTFETYCRGDCVAGVAVQAANTSQDDVRCALGIGYLGLGSGAFLQEVAHTLGRPHAPCGGATTVDPNYPYPNGGIGVWGYDLLRRRLVDPARNADFMSYCTPVWVSDYTYTRMAAWLQAVNAL